MPSVSYFYEDIAFTIKNPLKRSRWIKAAIAQEGFSLATLNYIFCSDQHLAEINLQYLNHNTLTDIITFDNSEGKNKIIEGDIFISVERVADNARKFNVSFETELDRVMIHGTLHLLGYKDKTAAQKALMRKKEDAYLSLR